MHSLLFATGNARKISEAIGTLTPFEITIQPIKLHFDEIQHTDPTEITKAKARAAFAAAGSTQPVVV
ncbi:MAG: non-canonical purine NTP pyrophosphatase, partial [Candidatus Saccharimonadales bacterium]